MEYRQNRVQLPILKKLPYFENVQHLHNHNKHVTQVCKASNFAEVQAYDENKKQYQRENGEKDMVRSRVMEEKEMARRKSLEEKRKEHWKKNRENLQKLEHVLADRRSRLAKKEEQHMQESQQRKFQYQKTHYAHSSMHHYTTDPLSKMKIRQQVELGYSLNLLQQNQKKVEAANERKMEQLYVSKTSKIAQQLGQSRSAFAKSQEKEKEHQDVQLKRIIQKYSAAEQRISSISSFIDKNAESKRVELQKSLEKHKKQRTKVKEEQENIIEADVKANLAKLDQADSTREKAHQQQQMQMEAKRRHRERVFMSNSFYLQEEADKKAQTVLQRHHESLVNLTNSKVQRQLLRCSNLHDSFRAALRS